MKQFFKLFGKYIHPCRRYITGGIITNILSALFNLFTFSLVMSILHILFGMERITFAYRTLDNINWLRPPDRSVVIDYIVNSLNYYTSQLIQQYGPSRTLLLLCIYLVVMMLIKAGVTYDGIYIPVPIRTGVVRDLRNEFNTELLRLSISLISKEHKGDLLARFSGGVTGIGYSIISILESLIKNPILIVIYLIAPSAISWEFTLFVFFVLPIVGYIMGAADKCFERDSLEGQTQWGQLVSMIEETPSGLHIIKAFDTGQQIFHRFTSANEHYRRTIAQAYVRQGLAHPMSKFLGTTAIAIILWCGGDPIFASSSSTTTDVFIYYLAIFYSVINPAKGPSRVSCSIQKGLAFVTRIQAVFDYPERVADPVGPLSATFDQDISYEDVSFRCQRPWIICHLNLTISKGQMIALVGASGAGKSTLADLLSRFYGVTSGRAAIDDTNVWQVEASDLRSLIGYVNQTLILFNDTVRNNITFGMERPVSDGEVYTATGAANAIEFINQLPEEVEYSISDGGNRLGSGQCQQLSIARALLRDSSILILGEATSAFGNVSGQLAQEAIQRLVSSRTITVVTHRLSTIMRADLICVMQEGQVVGQGIHGELLGRDGIHAHLYQVQSKE